MEEESEEILGGFQGPFKYKLRKDMELIKDTLNGKNGELEVKKGKAKLKVNERIRSKTWGDCKSFLDLEGGIFIGDRKVESVGYYFECKEDSIDMALVKLGRQASDQDFKDLNLPTIADIISEVMGDLGGRPRQGYLGGSGIIKNYVHYPCVLAYTYVPNVICHMIIKTKRKYAAIMFVSNPYWELTREDLKETLRVMEELSMVKPVFKELPVNDRVALIAKMI